MATTAQINAFISKIAPCAQKAYATLGKILPSVCIGMACIESAYGTAGSCKYNSYLGQKVGTGKTATKYWTKTFKSWKTNEEYTVGRNTVITDAFRTYPTMEMCVFNYYELLNSGVYKSVKIGVDYVTQMQQIKKAGYMTSSKEVNAVLTIIKKYNLTKYDAIKAVNTADQPKPAADAEYKVGETYVLCANLNVRTTPNGELVKTVTADAKKHMSTFPVLNSGTKITCKDTAKESDGSIWIKCPSGWLCAVSKGGKVYIKKV